MPVTCPSGLESSIAFKSFIFKNASLFFPRETVSGVATTV